MGRQGQWEATKLMAYHGQTKGSERPQHYDGLSWVDKGSGRPQHYDDLSWVDKGNGRPQHYDGLSWVDKGSGRPQHYDGLSWVDKGNGRPQHYDGLSWVDKGSVRPQHYDGLSWVDKCNLYFDMDKTKRQIHFEPFMAIKCPATQCIRTVVAYGASCGVGIKISDYTYFAKCQPLSPMSKIDQC